MEQRTTVNSEILETIAGKIQSGPATTLWRKEMVELILSAMGALNLEYRTVLTLRCLEDQSYAEIAVVLGGSQMRAKMLFYLAKTDTVSILSVWKKPTPPLWPGPGQPRFDSNMGFMGQPDGYFFLTEIAASHNPDKDDWRCYVRWPREQDLQFIASLKDKPANAKLILEQDHWIEYPIPAALRDRPGPDIGLTVRNSGTLPSVYLTDGGQRLQEISVTHYRAGGAPEFLLLGFDLSGIAIDFRVRRLRIVGHDRAGKFGGCGIINLSVSLARK